MSEKNYNGRDLQQVKTVDTLIEVCTKYSSFLSIVPKFAEKFDLLKILRSEVSIQSVEKHQAQISKTTIVSDLDAEKLALATYVSQETALFLEFCQDEKEAGLQNMLPNLTLTKLKGQKPLNMVTTLQSFVKTASTINFVKAKQYGIDKTWVETLTNKVNNYNDLLPKQNTSKQNKPQSTADLRLSIKNLMVVKKSLDNLITGFRVKQPEFYNAYKVAKVVASTAPKNNNKLPKKPKKAPVTTVLPVTTTKNDSVKSLE